MKQLFLLAFATLFGLQTAQAQKTTLGIFNHVGLGVSVGTDGIGFDVAAPITDYAAVRAGMSIFPTIKYDDDVKIDSKSKSFSKNEVNVEGKLNMKDFKFLVDLYPSKYSSFHFTAGAFIGPEKLITAYNTESFLDPSEWGVSGVKLGDYRVTSDKNGNVEANIEVAGFKPYVGIGFGRAVPKKSRVTVSCDFGVKFWGEPGVYTWTTDNFGNRSYNKLTKEDVDEDDADKAFDIMSKIVVYPVLNIRLTGRIF